MGVGRLMCAGGGIRKCVGDQFAIMEATVALTMLLRQASQPASRPPPGCPSCCLSALSP